MFISPFTPLFFRQNIKSDGLHSRYIQLFAQTDVILIEIIMTGNSAPIGKICNISLQKEYEISWNTWNINDEQRLWFTTISGLSLGLYSVYINGAGYSEPFKITSDDYELSQTTLIQYSNKDNKQRLDVVFHINRMQYFFDFRVPGGFKDSNWTFGVENEQFVTDQSDIIELYAMDSTQHTFTLGTNIGCPIWFAEKLNRLLCCNYVYFDGIRYARKDSSVPEMTVQMEGLDSFVFKQMLQRVNNINPIIENNNQAIIRRINDENYNVIQSDNETLYQRLIKYT